MSLTNDGAGSRLQTISLGYLLAHRFRPREDLIFPWLRQGESAMLWAAPGTGKTLLTLTMAVMVAGGGSVLGWNSPKPRRVLLVDGEMAAEDLQERVAWLIDTVEGIDRDAAAANLMILSRNELRLFASRSRRKKPVGRTREVRTSATGYGDFTLGTLRRER